MWMSNRWVTVRSQIAGAIVVMVVAIVVVKEAETIGSTLGGLVLMYSLTFTDAVTYMIRCHSDCQMSMNSVERIMEYSNIDSEQYFCEGIDVDKNEFKSIAPHIGNEHDEGDVELGTPYALTSQNASAAIQALDDGLYTKDIYGDAIDGEWLKEGTIEFRNVDMRYRDGTPLVLRQISFKVEANLKVGVCGRSGAGKSSLISALFRTVEPCAGELLLGGMNVLNMPLKMLRSSLSIVPQDPVLFKGSIKSNLDPFDQASNTEIWLALSKVHMSAHVASLPGGTGADSGAVGAHMMRTHRYIFECVYQVHIKTYLVYKYISYTLCT
jgi:ABC-type multidrug transport system fused ATPase/permease subunit